MTTFTRNPTTGALTYSGCISNLALAGCTTADNASLDGAFGVTVSPDGASVYVAANSSDAVTTFTRTAAAPTVTSISPTGGPLAGDTSVTITGTGIAAGATATIGGNTCTAPTVTPPTQITCTAPAGTAGAKNIVVTNPNTQTGTLTGGYTYIAAPPPGPGTAQTPTNNCVTAPGTKAIPRAGLKRLTRPHCRTNAGQKVTTKVTGQLAPRGDATLCKVIRKKNGAVFIRTYGYRLKLTITWSAPATGTYAAYKQTRTYRT